MNKKFMILILVVGLLTTIIAQPKGTGSISGTIRDNAKQGLANASIEAFLGTQRIAATSSDAKGAYKLIQLNPGKYTIVVKLTGYKTSSTEVKVNPAKNSIHNVTLKVDEGLLPIQRAKGDAGPGSAATAQAESYAGGFAVSDMLSISSGAYAAPYPGMYIPPNNTEEYTAINPNIFHSPLAEPLSTFSIDVDTANYSNLRRYLNQGQLPPKNSIRIEELINYFSYDYPEPKGEHPFSVYTEMGVNPWNQKRNLVHIGIKGRAIDLKTAPASNLVFLIDVSGSMNTPQKLPLVKESMKMLVANLRPIDKIAIAVYAGSAGLVLPSSDGAEKGKIIQAIEDLEAGGSTAGGAGIRLAYKTALDNFIKGGNNRIILCTDGDFNVGVSSTADLEGLVSEYRSKGVYLTVLGYGMGNYKDNRMETLADKGNGNYAYIDNINEAKKVLVTEMGSTLFTIAKDVKLQVEFNPAHVKAYRLIGYENRMLRTEDFKDDTKDAGELGAGHTVTAIYEIIPANSKETLPELDTLKYQDVKISDEARKSPEVMTVKMRYKKPDSDVSIPLETPVYNKTLGLKDVSETFTFANAVVGYGMLLQDSEHKAALTWEMVREMAKASLGSDKEGYRKEFLDLVNRAEKLSTGEYRPNPNYYDWE